MEDPDAGLPPRVGHAELGAEEPGQGPQVRRSSMMTCWSTAIMPSAAFTRSTARPKASPCRGPAAAPSRGGRRERGCACGTPSSGSASGCRPWRRSWRVRDLPRAVQRRRRRARLPLAAAPGQDAADGGIDRWAAADAMPSSEEISRLRALISRVTAGLGDLTAAERAEIDGCCSRVGAAVDRHGWPAGAGLVILSRAVPAGSGRCRSRA